MERSAQVFVELLRCCQPSEGNMPKFLMLMAGLAVLITAASADAAMGRTPLKLIEGRAAYEASWHYYGNDFGPDFERILLIPDKAA
jgi:hypothetical protein